MRWWNIVTLVLNIASIVQWKCKKKGLQSFRPSKLLQCPPQSPPPKGDQFPGNDVPGHATRLVATQQPDKALHFTTSLAGGLCGFQKLQAFNDKSCKLRQIILPHKLPHANVWTKELLIFLLPILLLPILAC